MIEPSDFFLFILQISSMQFQAQFYFYKTLNNYYLYREDPMFPMQRAWFSCSHPLPVSYRGSEPQGAECSYMSKNECKFL